MRTFLLALLLAPALLVAETYSGAPVNLTFGPEVTVGRRAFLAGLATVYLPRIADALGAPFDYATPIEIHATEAKDAPPGVTLGRAITVSEPHLRAHPDDAGMFVHELTHVVQAYPAGKTPTWLTEGITDYLRYYILLPEPARRANPATADHTKGYAQATPPRPPRPHPPQRRRARPPPPPQRRLPPRRKRRRLAHPHLRRHPRSPHARTPRRRQNTQRPLTPTHTDKKRGAPTGAPRFSHRNLPNERRRPCPRPKGMVGCAGLGPATPTV